jgi:hypothetical protein
MSKNKFDPSALQASAPTPSLQPVDFMRPMEPMPQPTVEPVAPGPTASSRAKPTSEALVHKDSRYSAPPADDVFEAKTYRLKRHRHKQLRDESYFTNQDMQVIVDTALGEYFEKRYGVSRGKQ